MNRANYLALACSMVLVLAAGQARATIVQDFNYTGSSQNFNVPGGVSIITIEAWGAQGWSGSNQGGRGGYTIGNLSVAAGELLGVYVGGQGTGANVAFTPMGGGFNGGGHGQTYLSLSPTIFAVGGGGGASDVRRSGLSLVDRIIVAGGGGGSANNDGPFGGAGGAGGGAAGGSAPGSGTGGTQSVGGSMGGSFGQGGNAMSEMSFYNGGGGGGWYGGGVSPGQAGGGGGSSFIPPSGLTIGGMRTGSGLVRFTYEIASVPETSSFCLLGVIATGLICAWSWKKISQKCAA
jgi:hypothetical protein